jgi:hypothetical protein
MGLMGKAAQYRTILLRYLSIKTAVSFLNMGQKFEISLSAVFVNPRFFKHIETLWALTGYTNLTISWGKTPAYQSRSAYLNYMYFWKPTKT